jgi:hypothetical protein
MSLIDPAHRADLGHWPEPRRRPTREPRRFKLAAAPKADALPPAPLTAIPALLEPATELCSPVALRISFYAEHQPLATPEAPAGTRWDVSV